MSYYLNLIQTFIFALALAVQGAGAQGLAGGTCRAASVRRDRGCPMMEQPQGLAEPHSRNSSTFGKAWVRMGKRGEVWARALGSLRREWEEGRRWSRTPGRNSPTPPGEDHNGAGGCCLKEAAALESPQRSTVYPEGLLCVGSTSTGAGEKCEEEGTAERSCYGLTTAQIPNSLALLREEGCREAENIGVKFSLGRTGEVVGRCFKFCFGLSTPFLFINIQLYFNGQ